MGLFFIADKIEIGTPSASYHPPSIVNMNTLPTLCEIRNYLNESDYLLDNRLGDNISLWRISNYIQECAKKLNELEEGRIKEIQEHGPLISYDRNGYGALALLREGKEEYYNFPMGTSLYLNQSTDPDASMRAGLGHGPPLDPSRYFISLSSGESFRTKTGLQREAIWVTEEEATSLRIQLKGDEYEICTFCGASEEDCGGDHVDEMREARHRH